MTTKVVKGSLWTLTGQVIPLGVSLIATYFVIRFLGADGYGVLMFVGLIPMYLGFADFGMSIASTKFGSEAFAQGDTEKEGKVVRTAAVIAFLASLPFGIAIFMLSGWLVTLFNVPDHLQGEAAVALKFASVTFVVNFLNGIFNTPQLTRLRMDLNTLVTSGFRTLGIIATPIVLYLGGGIAGAVFVLLAASLLTLLGHLYISGRLLRHLFEFTVDRRAIRPMLKFGGALVVGGVAGILLVNVEKGVLARMVSTTALGFYSLAFTLASTLTMFSSAMIQSLLPAFSQLQTKDKHDQLNLLYSRGIRINLIWLIPAIVFLSIVAKPFFTIWAGEEFGRESVLPFYILLAGVAFNILAYFPHTAIMASGRTDLFAKLYWIELIAYMALVWMLTVRYGIVGAALSWSIRVIGDAVLLFLLAKRIGGVTYSRRGAYSFLIAVAVMFVPFVSRLYFPELRVAIIIVAMISLAVYAYIVWKTSLEKEELAWLTNRINAYLAR